MTKYVFMPLIYPSLKLIRIATLPITRHYDFTGYTVERGGGGRGDEVIRGRVRVRVKMRGRVRGRYKIYVYNIYYAFI